MKSRTITSPHNRRIRDALGLRSRRQRTKQRRTLIDGIREITRAIEAQVRLVDVFVCQPLCQGPESHALLVRLDELDSPVWYVTPQVFERIAFGQRHEGAVAVAHTPQRAINQIQLSDGGLIAVACGLEKPGNVGAILRTADAAGVAATIVADSRTDLYNPNCIRSSLGTIFTQQVAEATTVETLAWLRAHGYQIFAARLDANRAYTEVDFRGNTAIVMGSEAGGLSDAWQADDVTSVKLPMQGAADSLNVSAAAAVLFYEALRQRAHAE